MTNRRPASALVTVSVAALLAGCGGAAQTTASTSTSSSTPSASSASASAPVSTTAMPPSSAATTTVVVPAPVAPSPAGPAITGFGATMAQWQATHTLDSTVVMKNAYLPHVANGVDMLSDTWQLVSVNSGDRVTSYTLNVPPTSFTAAVARARQELPGDATLLWSGLVAGTCYQAEWQSPTLASVLGSGYVNVVFDNAPTGNSTPITEGLFGDQAAPTMAQAPGC